jgi:hypothetical protein
MFISLVLIVLALPAWFEPPQARPAEVGRLIKQLDSDSFAERQAASKALMNIGEPALEDLRNIVETSMATAKGSDYVRPKIASRAKHPRTCGPGPRKCSRSRASMTPASSKAPARRSRSRVPSMKKRFT